MEQIKGTSGFDEPATDSSAHAVDDAPAQPPFFRLPRELRDEIYDLAVMSEEKFYYDIALRADGPAQKAVYIDRGAHRTFSDSQFEVEYSTAAERRIKSLVTGGDRCGLQLEGPGHPDYYPRQGEIKTRQGMAKAEDVWLEISKGPRADGHIGHSIHALVLGIRMKGPETTRLQPGPSVIFISSSQTRRSWDHVCVSIATGICMRRQLKWMAFSTFRLATIPWCSRYSASPQESTGKALSASTCCCTATS